MSPTNIKLALMHFLSAGTFITVLSVVGYPGGADFFRFAAGVPLTAIGPIVLVVSTLLGGLVIKRCYPKISSFEFFKISTFFYALSRVPLDFSAVGLAFAFGATMADIPSVVKEFVSIMDVAQFVISVGLFYFTSKFIFSNLASRT